jgi:diketogulonate reductase-like aldo/keto reductase
MIHRPIPRSSAALPAVGLGTYRAFDVGNGAAARAPLQDVLRTLVAQGGSVVDSSPMYGRAEAVVGDLQSALGLREQLFLATKVWTSGREDGIRQMEASFRLMCTQAMDLMQIHNLVDWRTHTATLKQWQQQGKVRYVGITHYHAGAHADLARLIETGDYDFVQFNFSIAEREAEARLLPLAQAKGVAVIVNRPFAQNALFARVRRTPLPSWAAEAGCRSWAQFFLRYILSHPAVTCVIPATGNPAHALDCCEAAQAPLPDQGMRERMARYFDGL